MSDPVSPTKTPETSSATATSDERAPVPESSWVRRNFWPLAGTVAIVAVGMAYSLFWATVYYGVHVWLTPGDIWSTFRDAHYVGWGAEGGLYASGTSLVTFPGIAVLLTPIAMLQNPLHLSSSIPIYLTHPTEWLVLGPIDLLLGGFFLFPLNKLAERLRITSRRRVVLIWAEAVLVFTVVQLWGHPEDTIAMAFGLYALIAVMDESWLHVGFFFGLAIAFQPLVLLMLPIMLVKIPWRRWPLLAGIMALPSAILLLGPLVKEWSATTRALLQQPNFPALNHPTPWLALAPALHHPRYLYTPTIVTHTAPDGKVTGAAVLKKILSGPVVSAGPGRELALALVVVIGLLLLRRSSTWPRLVWWLAVALSLRCVFESILDPFYFFPGLAIALLAAFTTTKWKMTLTIIFAGACVYFSYQHLSPWHYYLLVTITMVVALACAFPVKRTIRSEDPGANSGQPELLNV
ncbi:MAG: hypothetical protein WAN30_05560 [Acidimicrobiales bacterium]